MCLKGASGAISENILIENSTFLSTCNAFKFGTDTQGSLQNIIARNLNLGGTPAPLESFLGRHQASTGITIATVDGGNIENIYIHDVTIDRTRCPIFIRVANRGRVIESVKKPNPGYLKHILISNVSGKNNSTQGSLISGIKGYPVEDVIIRNMNLLMTGGGTSKMSHATVEEQESGYPDAQGFSREGLPSYGFYIRHAQNLILDNVKVTPVNKDERPAFKNGGDIKNITINGTILE